MAEVIEFVIKGRNQLTGPLSKANIAVSKLTGTVEKGVRQLFSLKSAIVGVGGGLLAKSFLDAASSTEQLNVRMQVLLGSMEEGARLFDEVTEFASKVPFELQEIASSATTLAGIMDGGVDEIKGWLPIIGDLAAVTGLGIQQTTEQVQRMLSAGAASADLFRERGVLAMLGFQAGVSVSAEETRKRLIEAWEDPASRFRGATTLLANTWDGMMSMIADKWFQVRKVIMDAGLFNFLKAIITVLDRRFGDVLDATTGKAKAWSDAIISGILVIMDGVGFMADAFRGLQVIWEFLKTGFLAFKGIALNAMIAINEKVLRFIELMAPFSDTAKQAAETIRGGLAASRAEAEANIIAFEDAKDSLERLALAPMPSEAVQRFREEVLAAAEEIAADVGRMKSTAASLVPGAGIGGTVEAATTSPLTQAMQQDVFQRLEVLREGMASERDLLIQKFEEDKFLLEEAFQEQLLTTGERHASMLQLEAQHQIALTELEKREAEARAKADKNSWDARLATTGNALRSLSNTVGGAFKGLFKIQQVFALKAATVAFFEGMTKTAGSVPFPANLGLIAGYIAKVAPMVAAIKGQAHGGLDFVPQEGTFLLNKGERVVQPEQNKDLTNFLQGQQGQGGVANGGVSIDNLTVNVMPNVTSAEQLRRMSDDELAEEIGTPIVRALNRLTDQGVNIKAIERG